MFRIFLLFTVVTVIIAIDHDIVSKKCGKLYHGKARSCCKSDIGHWTSPGFEMAMKECKQLPEKESCDRDICIATKHGFGTEEGKVIKDKAEETFSDDFKAYPKLVAAFKEKCIEGDISQFGHPDLCEVKKLRHCIDLQRLDQCPEWSDDGPCKDIKDAAKECISLFD